MPVDFHYVPTTGGLTGPAFISQTEQAFNDLGNVIDDVRELAEEAMDLANTALATAGEALLTSQEALSDSQRAHEAAQKAHQAANQAQASADTAYDRAQEAHSQAATALDMARQAQSGADAARDTADRAVTDAASLTVLAGQALDAARQAQRLAQDAQRLAVQAAGQFTTTSDPIAADAWCETAARLHVANTESDGFPVSAPLYFSVALTDDGATVLQQVWNDRETWYRTGRATCAVHAGTDELAVEIRSDTGETADASVRIIAGGETLELACAGLDAELRSRFSRTLEGRLSFSLANDCTGEVAVNGVPVVRVIQGLAHRLVAELKTDKGMLVLQEAFLSGSELKCAVGYTWSDCDPPVAQWRPWVCQTAPEEVEPDVFTTLSGTVDANGYAGQTGKYFVPREQAEHFPVNGPLYFETVADDSGDSVVQTVWPARGGTAYIRSAQSEREETDVSSRLILELPTEETALLDVQAPYGEIISCSLDNRTALPMELKILEESEEALYLRLTLEYAAYPSDPSSLEGAVTINDVVVAQRYETYAMAFDAILPLEGATLVVSSFAPVEEDDLDEDKDEEEEADRCHLYLIYAPIRDKFVFTDWQTVVPQGYEPDQTTMHLDADGCLAVVPATPVQDAGAAERFVVEQNTPPAVSLTPLADLDVTVAKLDQGIEKQTTLVIAPNADMALTWRTTGQAPVWLGETALEALAAREQAVVSVRQVYGLVLLRLLYRGTNPQSRAELELSVDSALDAALTFTGLNRGACGPDLTIDWGDGTAWTYDDLPASGDTTYSYAVPGVYTVRLGAEQADFILKGNACLTAADGNLPWSGVTPADLSSCFADCVHLERVGPDLFRHRAGTRSFASCFAGCRSLAAVPEALFATVGAAMDFSACFAGCAGLASLPEGLFASASSAVSFSGCFSGCTALQTLPERLFAATAGAADFSRCFSDCAGLAELPDGLFAGASSARTFASCFAGCSGLAALPERLFAHAGAATDFSSCFAGCSGLAAVPAELFAQSAAAVDMSGCFRDCAALAGVPQGFFDALDAAENLSACFAGCTALTTLPENLFENAPLITDVSGCCEGDAAILSAVPALWTRDTIIAHERCYAGCTQAANYEEIPEGWK